ncbi:MAG: N-acetyltransferase family protein [Lautropia sp.]
MIRRLTPADAARYRELMLEAYESEPEAFTSTVAERERLPLSWWSERLSEDAAAVDRVVGAFVAGRLVGAAGLSSAQRARTRHKGLLFGMYVREEARGRGVGALLVTEILRQAEQSARISVVQLTVSEGNAAAIRLYRRCGFAQFGLEPFAVRIGPRFISKVHMWRAVTPAP